MGLLRKKIFHGTTIISFGNIIARFAAFFSVIIFTRGVSLFDYGIISLLLSITGPVNASTGLGMDELIVADASRSLGEKRFDRAKKIILSFFSVRLILLAVVVLIGILLKSVLAGHYGDSFTKYLTLLILLIFVQFIRNTFNIILNIHQQFSAMAFLNISEPVIKLIIASILLVKNMLSIQTILFSYVLSTGVTVLIMIPIVLKTLNYFFYTHSSNEPILKTTFQAHGKWQFMLDIISNISSTLKYWLIKIFLSAEAVAIFSVAQSMYSAVSSFLPFKSVIFPIISQKSGDPHLRQLLVQKITKYAIILYSAALIVLYIFSPSIIRFLFPKYLSAVLIFQLMIFRLPLNAFSLAQAPMFVALREQKFLSLIAIKNTLSALIFAPLLMIWFGLPGAVIEGFIPVILSIVWREGYLRKKYGFASLTPRALFTIDKFDRALFLSIRNRLRI